MSHSFEQLGRLLLRVARSRLAQLPVVTLAAARKEFVHRRDDGCGRKRSQTLAATRDVALAAFLRTRHAWTTALNEAYAPARLSTCAQPRIRSFIVSGGPWAPAHRIGRPV